MITGENGIFSMHTWKNDLVGFVVFYESDKKLLEYVFFQSLVRAKSMSTADYNTLQKFRNDTNAVVYLVIETKNSYVRHIMGPFFVPNENIFETDSNGYVHGYHVECLDRFLLGINQELDAGETAKHVITLEKFTQLAQMSQNYLEQQKSTNTSEAKPCEGENTGKRRKTLDLPAGYGSMPQSLLALKPTLEPDLDQETSHEAGLS